MWKSSARCILSGGSVNISATPGLAFDSWPELSAQSAPGYCPQVGANMSNVTESIESTLTTSAAQNNPGPELTSLS